MPGWDTLFDFNGTIGSQWEVGIGWVHPLEQLTISLRDTFTTQINGKDLKALVIGYTKSPSNPNYLLDTVITYIGNKNLFIIPGTRFVSGGDTQFGGPIKCFFNNTLGGIQMRDENISGYDYDCDQLVNTTELHIYEKDFILSPNPVEDELSISSLSEKIIRLEVFDLYGNLVEKKTKLNTIEARLPLSHLSKGIYFVRVNGGYLQKLLKM